MKPLRSLSELSIGAACLFAIFGCSTATTSPATTTPGAPNPASYLYLAQNSPAPYSSPSQILIYPTGVSGNPSPTNIIILPNSITAGPIAVDSAGNIYVATPTDIREYAASATGAATPIRLIPTNATTTLNVIAGLALDSAGNIYALNLGVGIDIFSAAANGSVAPSRIIPLGGATTLSIAQHIAVDGPGNLYVANLNASAQFTIAVFGPTANGSVAPDRVLNDEYAIDLATDSYNNLYVATFNAGTEIDVFAPGASGNAKPARVLSLGQDALVGFAAGPAGDLYVGTNGSLLNNAQTATPVLLEYSATASDAAAFTSSFVPGYVAAGSSGMAAR
jgi:hypothetical protein